MLPESSSSQSDNLRPDVALWAAWLPVVVLIILLAVNVYIFSDNATFGSNQIALWLAAMVAGVVGRFHGIGFQLMADGIARSVHSAMSAILILLGYSLIIVPTGFVSAELVSTKNQTVTTQSCPHCMAEGHAADAVFCRVCGRSV